MLGDESVLRRVAWSELFPWLILVRCFRLAIRFRALLLATLAILATFSGWALLGLIFSGDARVDQQTWGYSRCPWLALSAIVPDRPLGPSGPTTELADAIGASGPASVFVRAWEPLVGSWEQLSRPFRQLFSGGITGAQAAFLMLSGLWAVVVWAFFGAALTRTAAVELATEQRIGWGSLLRHAVSKWPSYVAAPLMPLLAVLAAAFLSALVGLLLRAEVGILLAALVWPLMLLGWAIMAVLLLGLLFGWPLMWPVISAEGTDSFDALSRTYNYLFSRPLHALFYTLVAMGIGILGWTLVSNFAAAVVYLAYWAASWGGGEQAIRAITSGEGLGVLGATGAMLIRVSVECVKLLAAGFLYSYLWTAATAIYLLLRRNVDAREMDEVFLDDDAPVLPLPTLKTDDSGVPEVVDEPEGGSETESKSS
jgi:hypothetical protein